MVVQKIGFLFPGQGAQTVGMGADWAEGFEGARRLYQEAEAILGFPLREFCFKGPEETLTRTLYAQPAIFVTSLAVLAALEEKFPELTPDFTAGLSLGEFTALVAAGSLSFQEGLKLVKRRAELMETAANKDRGAMVSILGLNQDECEALARESGAELANLNAPDQFVLSGTESSVHRARDLAEARGAKRALVLKVGGAFHSSLMKPAKIGLEEALRTVKLGSPRCLFAANVSAKAESEGEVIRSLLGEQLTHPVRWIETMQLAQSQGVRRFLEIGPGSVLKGLAKRIDRTLEVLSVQRVSDLESVEAMLQKG